MAAPGIQERMISLGGSLAPIPERLLLAHARGEVLFIAGAGISRPANLPDFRELVLQVYSELDAAAHAVMSNIPRDACNQWGVNLAGLAEARRMVAYAQENGWLPTRVRNDNSDGEADAISLIALD